MPITPRRWEATIEFSTDPEWLNQVNEFIVLYGESIDKLRSTVESFILNKKPVYFGCKGDHVAGQWRYFYSDGKRALALSPRKEPQILAEGWWVQREPLAGWGEHLLSSNTPQELANLESAVKHFLITTLIPVKGPDYRSGAIVENSLLLFLLEKVLREKDEHLINDLITRGWHIIGLEYQGEASRTGELMNRRAQFVLGHPDYKAAQATLIARDMNE